MLLQYLSLYRRSFHFGWNKTVIKTKPSAFPAVPVTSGMWFRPQETLSFDENWDTFWWVKESQLMIKSSRIQYNACKQVWEMATYNSRFNLVVFVTHKEGVLPADTTHTNKPFSWPAVGSLGRLDHWASFKRLNRKQSRKEVEGKLDHCMPWNIRKEKRSWIFTGSYTMS